MATNCPDHWSILSLVGCFLFASFLSVWSSFPTLQPCVSNSYSSFKTQFCLLHEAPRSCSWRCFLSPLNIHSTSAPPPLSLLKPAFYFLIKLFLHMLKQLFTPTISYVSLYLSISVQCSVPQSCLTLCDPMDCSPSGSSVHRISQERILEWVALSYSRGSSWSRDWTRISCTSSVVDEFLNTEPSGSI